MLGCSHREVERIHEILKDGTAEIICAVKDGKLKINRAYNIIVRREREAKTGRPVPTRKKPRVDVDEIVGTWLIQEELAVFKNLGGSLGVHVKAAVKRHVRWLREEGGMQNAPGSV